jgi:Spy/CpxP family protein refolding chaperone
MNKRDHSKMNRSKAHKIIVTIIVTLVASVTLWAIAHAVNDDGQRRGHRGGPAAMLSWHLDLSDDQEDRVEAIFNSAHTEGEAIRSELGSLRREVVESIRANGYQEDQVRIRIESETPKMVDLMLSRIRTMAEVYEVLTPEQQARVDEFIDEGPGFGRGRRHGLGFGGF